MAVITTLLLTRHGEAHCNVAGLAGGEKTCTGLTEHGQHQVDALARRLLDSGPPAGVLYAAPRRRVRESAAILSGVLSIPVSVEPGLDGLRHGEADGQPWDKIKASFGGPPQSDPGRPFARGSESWSQLLARTGQALAALTERHRGQVILIAGHAETIHAAAGLLLGLAPEAWLRCGFEISHASLTCWKLERNRFGREVWNLAMLNDTCHLR